MSFRKKRNIVVERENNLASTVDKLSAQLQNSDNENSKQSESAQAIETMNKDIRDDDGLSSIDPHTDLSHNQIIAITKLESLSNLDFMSGDDDDDDDAIRKITRVFQRKQISKDRQGRKEAIQLFQEMETKKDSKGFWEKWFSPKE